MNQYVAQWAGRKNGLANFLKAQVDTFAACNIGAIELPPLRLTQGYGPNCVSLGYDPIKDLDWGQCGDATRVGTEEEIQALSRYAHKKGLLVTADFVNRQYGGNPPYQERGRDGKPISTFYKPAGLFAVPPDNQWDATIVPADGTLARYEFSYPKGWFLAQKVAADKALIAALGLDGGRQDEAKSMWAPALRAMFAARPGGWNVAEYYDGNPAILDPFAVYFDTPVIDFPAHYAYRDVSNGMSCRRLVGSSYGDWRPQYSYKYVESLDTDGPFGVISNKRWFYLHGMTTPCRVFRIYAGDYEGYGLGPTIRNYAWCSHLALGNLFYSIIEDDLLCWYRDGDGGSLGRTPGLLCGFSRDPINTQWRWVKTPFPPNTEIQNYAESGGPNRWTNQDGWAYLPFGPNVFNTADNGVAWSVAGLSGSITLPERPDKIVPAVA